MKTLDIKKMTFSQLKSMVENGTLDWREVVDELARRIEMKK